MIRNSIFGALALAACASTPRPAPGTPAPSFDERSVCADVPTDSPICRADVSGVDEAAARAALGDDEFAIVRDDPQHLTILARAAGPEVNLCCSLQGSMTRIGESDAFVSRYRLMRLDEATLVFLPPAWLESQRQIAWGEEYRWQGPHAPQPPALVQELRGERFERTLWSDHLGETRRIYIYLPPGYDRSRTYPAVFMADGASVMVDAPLFEQLIAEGAMPPAVFIGAASGPEAIVEDRSSLGIADLRAADYLPGYEGGGERFEQHLRFFAEELVAYATREFNIANDPSKRAVTGFSNGGSFSLFAALRRPDVFGIAIPLSPSWRRLTDADFAQTARARFLMAAGLYEIRRHGRATQYAEALRARGYEVAMETPVMGHDRGQETAMLARYLPIAFPPTGD